MVHRDVEDILKTRPSGDFSFIKKQGEFFQGDETLPYFNHRIVVSEGKVVIVTPLTPRCRFANPAHDTSVRIW